MWAISVPILVFLGLSVLDLGQIYATDIRQTDVRQHHRFPGLGAGHNNRKLHPAYGMVCLVTLLTSLTALRS